MAEVDHVTVELTVHRRWSFWPAAVGMVVLGRLGILKSPDRAAKWLADRAMVIEVR